MAATTTLSTHKLINLVTTHYPNLTFTAGDYFAWQPETNTITYQIDDPSFEARLLHEIGHSILGHTGYDRDISLIGMERDAWQIAQSELAPLCNATITSDHIEDDMDTYRDWLHSRSTCPTCSANGIQKTRTAYACISCNATWRVNEARRCALRRYQTT